MSNTTTTQHTPTPWELSEGGLNVNAENGSVLRIAVTSGADVGPGWSGTDYATFEHSKANAAFIIRACNSHEPLVAALVEAVEIIQAIDQADNTCEKRIDVSEFRAALAAAGAQ